MGVLGNHPVYKETRSYFSSSISSEHTELFQHIDASTEWLTFCKHFQMHFDGKFVHFDLYFMKCVSKGPFANKSSVQVMVWYRMNRWQAIPWTSDFPVYWLIYVFLIKRVTSHEGHGISNHQQHSCLLNSLFSPKLCITGNPLAPGDSPHKGSVTKRVVPCHDIIIYNQYNGCWTWIQGINRHDWVLILLVLNILPHENIGLKEIDHNWVF